MVDGNMLSWNPDGVAIEEIGTIIWIKTIDENLIS
jgi:hypothetical protein